MLDGRTGRAAVAAGSADTAAAGVAVLRAGGNAFDAVVAAGFAATVAEPGLSSLGGGGFMLAAPAGEPATVVDFFVDAPGRGRPPERLVPSFLPITIRFPGADQVFHAGWGSVAVPGCLDGWLHVHRRFGRLPLADVVAPAQQLARRGAVLDPGQAAIVAVLEQILTLSPEGRAVFAPDGRLVRAGERLRNPALADLLDDVAAGRVTRFADLGGPLEEAMDRSGGPLTAADLEAYAVAERQPLHARYRGADVAVNPPPSFGGPLVVDGLRALEPVPAPALVDLATVLVAMSERHLTVPTGAIRSSKGTTHISVADADGDLAAMTVSNGSCSGVFAPGTGVQLNNVMGESDLHPHGFTATAPGTRVGSMMTPTLLTTADGTRVAMGSGGSERIRSALTCVLTAIVDRGLPLPEAVLAPRMHWDRSTLQVEPGLPADDVAALRRRWPVGEWAQRDFYFGGAQAVLRRPDGTVEAAADDRRGGVAVVL
ncbi:MAG TPA: gamma-glutamyltransferase [Mycobacteriales bacterium]|nr:gamma-glutamyltransferase [Mycobacteriales bacterium]